MKLVKIRVSSISHTSSTLLCLAFGSTAEIIHWVVDAKRLRGEGASDEQCYLIVVLKELVLRVLKQHKSNFIESLGG